MISQHQGETLLRIARESLASRFGSPSPVIPSEPWLNEPRGAFVTVRSGPRLHGCIGTIEPVRSLGATVARNAELASFEDPRSRPLTRDELEQVRLEVSVLSRPEPLPIRGLEDACAKLRPHVDGVVLVWGRHRGVFRPQVWGSLPDPRDFLHALTEKAGLRGWRDDITLERFAVEKFTEPGYAED